MIQGDVALKTHLCNKYSISNHKPKYTKEGRNIDKLYLSTEHIDYLSTQMGERLINLYSNLIQRFYRQFFHK